jgi:hypothetical protein
MKKIKTNVRAGALSFNHNGVKIKTKVRAGALSFNHNGVKI